jgi:DNA-binding IclR family transcriptional regulator
VLAGGEALYVQTIYGHRPVERTGRTGTRVPLTSTSIGQVLLAHAPSEVLEQVLADEARPTTDLPAVPPQRLRAVLADIRRSGIAVSRAGAGSLAVAAPVFGSPTGVAALGLIASEQAESRLIIPMVCTTAQRVSRELLGSVAANGVDAGCTVAAAPFAPSRWGRANCT